MYIWNYSLYISKNKHLQRLDMCIKIRNTYIIYYMYLAILMSGWMEPVAKSLETV